MEGFLRCGGGEVRQPGRSGKAEILASAGLGVVNGAPAQERELPGSDLVLPSSGRGCGSGLWGQGEGVVLTPRVSGQSRIQAVGRRGRVPEPQRPATPGPGRQCSARPWPCTLSSLQV